MSEKKRDYVRDEFLEWLADECRLRGESYTICTDQDRFDRYRLVWVQTSWIAWQASREAVVVERPDKCEFAEPGGDYENGYRQGIRSMVDMVEAEGIKVAQ